MKTKLTSVTYLGYTAMDRRFSTSMLPWLLREIRANRIRDKLSVTIEDGYLKAFNENFEPVIVHRLVDIIRASQVPGRPEELFYILFNEKEGLLNCFLFKAATVVEVTDLFTQMREPSPGTASPKGSTSSLNNASVTKNIGFSNQNSTEHLPWNSPGISVTGNCNSNLTSEQSLVRSNSNASALTSLSADLSPSESHFFEVLYIGKVRISQRKVPETLIDDALNKFSQHEAEKALRRRHSLLSSTGTSLYSNDSKENLAEDKKSEVIDGVRAVTLTPSTTPLKPEKETWKSVETLIPKTETKAVDDDFDMFTKERVEKKPSTIKRPTSIPLEPSILVLNLPKGNVKNLGTVTEDEEKDLRTVISETAKDINKFCEERNETRKNCPNAANLEKSNPFNDIQPSPKDPFTPVTVEARIQEVIKTDKGIQSADKTVEKNKEINFEEIGRRNNGDKNRKMPENKPFLRDRSASIGTITHKTPIAQLIGEQNRTMLFQVGRSELRLISPDRKQILLHREFKDVASCVLGRSNKDHFGFVCRETNDTYACYVFKCESDSVATEVVNAIKQAFVSHADFLKKTRDKSPNMTCEHCPMLWYHRLCHDIEGLNDKKTHAFILRRIEQLPEEEQDIIITKYQGGTNHIFETGEHNAFLMMLLRAHCEGKQQRHVHDTAENRSEFLNQFLGGGAILVKKLAKRSFSSGFDHLLKRKASRDDLLHDIKKETSPLPTPSTPENETPPSELAPPDLRCKSLSPAVISLDESASSAKHAMTPTLEEGEEEMNQSVNSPMMDIFLKVSDNRPAQTTGGREPDATWRQAIYRKVVQPSDVQEELGVNLLRKPSIQGKKNKEELRQLWKMAIEQTILLVRMEKENARLRENEESSAVRRIKLEYTELGGSDAGTTLMWDSLLSRDSSQPTAKVDRHMLTQAVKQGVPRVSRGAVWYFLAEQASFQAAPPDTTLHPNYHTPYKTLLSSLSKHHHAILIDLGRTFPKHSYFASALGPGQLALYNILKAYSLLDPDVGYCQGLSFVAGVLLLHMEEAEAYLLLRHLMFRRGLRKQYLPDMVALQVQLYQLSRLLRDHEPELHAKLESLDISPALYAAPWMLTLFTSQFPLGFVVRIFDLIFLDSLDVVFSVSLAILSVHRAGLMLCESCEEAAEYLKHKLPDMTPQAHRLIMQKVHSLDISRQLSDYAVEYAVLREEMPRVATLTEQNRQLTADTSRMADELDSAMDAITNYQKNQARLESTNKTLEQHITLLSRFIANPKQEMPIEIKKIVQNRSKRLSFSSKLFSTKFSSVDEDKLHKTGASTPNLFAKINREEFAKNNKEELAKMNKEELTNVKEKESPEKEKRPFMMKKSMSVQSGLTAPSVKLKILEEQSEIHEDLKELGKRSSFFANTHEQIRQERLFEKQLKHDFDENLKKFDNKLSPNSYIDDLSIFQSRKSVSLNIPDKNDSGFVTPMTPDQKINATISHPLSDVGVDIKFDGQSTKLKQIRPTKCSDSKT